MLDPTVRIPWPGRLTAGFYATALLISPLLAVVVVAALIRQPRRSP